MNKAAAKREACALVGTVILAAPSDFVEGASLDFDTDEDELRVYGALLDLAAELIRRGGKDA